MELTLVPVMWAAPDPHLEFSENQIAYSMETFLSAKFLTKLTLGGVKGARYESVADACSRLLDRPVSVTVNGVQYR